MGKTQNIYGYNMAYREEDMFAFVMGNSYRVYLINEYFLENPFKPGKLLNLFLYLNRNIIWFLFLNILNTDIWFEMYP